MSSVAQYYWRMMTNINFAEGKTFGVLHLQAFLSILTTIFLLTLAVLVYRARPKSAENRFMAVLLTAEGIKVAEAWYNIYPVSTAFLPYIQYYRVLIFYSIVLSIMMYLTTCAFYPVRFLRFLTSDRIRSNLWWWLPCLSAMIVAYMIWSSGGLTEAFGGLMHISCPKGFEANSAIVTAYPFDSPSIQSICIDDAEFLPTSYIAPQNTGISQFLFLFPVFVATLAMMMMRSAWKSLAASEETEKAEEARALFIGFAGKAILKGSIAVFMIVITIIFGEFNPADVATIQDKNLLRLFLYSIYGFLFSILFTGMFEGIMFTYAILKREVLGIDEQLRKTFTATALTGTAAFLFLVSTEAMEEIIGVGWIGGVLISVIFVVLRKPLFSVVNGLSVGLMPEAFTAAEQDYLEAFALAMREQSVSERDRKFLQMQARALKLNESRIAYLEKWWIDNNSSLETS